MGATTQVLGVSKSASQSLTPFRSILFHESETDTDINRQETPEFFSDLHLDQIIESMVAGREGYDLKPFFKTSLHSVEAIEYRHQILRDLENQRLFECIQSFSQEMRNMRGHLAQAEKLHYKRQNESWFLDAVGIYCSAVRRLIHDLKLTDLRSSGFQGFREHLAAYIESNDFVSLSAETEKLRSDLSGIRYSLHIHGNRIKVSRYGGEPDYGADVLQTFEKFEQAAPRQYRFESPSYPDMNHVEAAILDMVAQLYPEIFTPLDEYCSRHGDYLDSTIRVFDREIQFYVACLEYAERLKDVGLAFCYPHVTDRSKELCGREAFDLALAHHLVNKKLPVVTNDFYLRDPERIIVVSGPNQGGKTTFARMFGQLHFLASIGCLVPGTEAKLFLYDRLFTHFEKKEDIRNLTGKLEDDLLRIHRILESLTANSILIMNESFLSTTLNDALFLSKQVMAQVVQREILCVTVTFLDELASFSDTTVSMMSTVSPKDPALRTFKLVRKPADGLAYAVAIAEKYHLTYPEVKTRIAENEHERVAS